MDTLFLPSEHGFAFSNCWEDSVLRLNVGDRPFTIALRGRCGGMAFAALDHYRVGLRASELAGPELPDRSSALAHYIMRRQIESLAGGLGTNMRRFVEWTVRPTGTSQGTVARTRRYEAGNILAAMVARNPVPLGLLVADRLGGLGLNHQVVAYATDQDAEQLRVRVYDPNYPLRDDIAIVVGWQGEGPFIEYRGREARKQWRGLFVERYAAHVPPGLADTEEEHD